MNAPLLLSEAHLAKAAFQLLASSTATRYLRVAMELVTECGLAWQLRRNPSLIAAALAQSRTLWRDLVAQNQRDLPEVELALWLTALCSVAPGEVLPLLKDIAASTAPSATWVKALSISLLKNRSHRQLVDCLVHPHTSGPHRRLLEQACT